MGRWVSNYTKPNGSGSGQLFSDLTDASGCTKTGSTSITQPTAITVTPTITAVSCYGQTTGAISLAVSGGTPGSSPLYTFAWNDGNTSQNRTGLAAGTYSVIVTDANNCTKTQSGIVVGQPSAVLGLSATTVNVACYGNSTGSINLTASGGTTPYGYNWGGGITSEDRTTLAAGTYAVTVTDASGCTAALSKTITQPVALSLSTVITKASCPGVSNGAITLTVSGGTSPFNFDWTDVAGTNNTQNRSAIAAGSYTVNVTDANGCTATTTLVVSNTNPNPVIPGTITK